MGWAIIECPCCGARMELGKHISMQTNADRIRSMSDEELAVALNRHCSCSSLRTWHEGMCDKPCRECWLDWLKQERVE